MKKGKKKWLTVALLAAVIAAGANGLVSPELLLDLSAEALGGAR